MPVNFVPEMNIDYTLTFDKNLVPQKTGIVCQSAEENNCVPGAQETVDSTYLGTKYNYFGDQTVMKLNPVFAKDEASPTFDIRRVSKIADGDVNSWKVEDSGVLGLSPKSDLVSYIYQ